ncbi:MAG: serine/threonine protein kinase, partial [Cyanobacteria bacterium RYN_339]|nr:serine/threonine protein kinase [Cyanobacteria bacterium RYN_339]
MNHRLPPRFEDASLLGVGGMGAVYRVFDREAGRHVALKVFQPAPGADAEEARYLFRQEFWALASLSHPGLVAGYDQGLMPDGEPYFTMELVPGVDLAPGQTEADVRAWLPGVAAALAYLHGRGYLHGDLKPENIRLGAQGPKLMDLGLLARSGRSGGALRGTLAYVAPEAIRQGTLDPRSDLYALGGVLYHVLTGHPPFADTDVLALLRAHLDRRPEPLAGVSTGLADAVARLLAKEPAARFPSARALLDALGLAGDAAEAASLFGSPVVGRDEALTLLDGALATPAPRLLWLTGPEGAGKTRLLAEARAQALLYDVPAVLARGEGPDAPPYQALRPWLRALVARPGEAVAQAAPVLVRILPELNVEPASPLEGAQERLRLHATVVDLARQALAGPQLWQLDDADRLDPASRALFDALVRAAKAAEGGAPAPWVFMAAGDAPPADAETITLAPLEASAVQALAGHLLGQPEAPATALERLAYLAGGRPGHVEAILAHWIRTGALRREAGAWAAVEDGAAFDLPGGLDVLHDARFQALEPQARRLASIAALMGAEGELPWLAALSDLAPEPFFAALANLEEAGIMQQAEGRYAFLRLGQAEALAVGWEAGEAKRLHSRAAGWLAERLGADDAAWPLDRLLALA